MLVLKNLSNKETVKEYIIRDRLLVTIGIGRFRVGCLLQLFQCHIGCGQFMIKIIDFSLFFYEVLFKPLDCFLQLTGLIVVFVILVLELFKIFFELFVLQLKMSRSARGSAGRRGSGDFELPNLELKVGFLSCGFVKLSG